MPRRLVLALFLSGHFMWQARADEPVRVFAAGSLTPPFTKMVKAFDVQADSIKLVFGPSGVLRERIENGEPADILASADTASPTRLASERGGLTVTPFVRNRLCIQGMQRLGLTPDTVLDKMLDPKLTLATSTPHADPGSDYAWAVFARADRVHPGAKAILEAKAKTLVGGPG